MSGESGTGGPGYCGCDSSPSHSWPGKAKYLVKEECLLEPLYLIWDLAGFVCSMSVKTRDAWLDSFAGLTLGIDNLLSVLCSKTFQATQQEKKHRTIIINVRVKNDCLHY